MLGIKYNAEFWRVEIGNLTLLLTQPVSPEYRGQLKSQLASARHHLAELETKTKSE